MSLVPKLLRFALLSFNTLKIDESHSLSHSMNVLHHANNILNSELESNPFLENQKNIIYTSAILHDICDNKYTDQEKGLSYIQDFLYKDTNLSENEINISIEIIDKMSYSKVKKKGFPNMGDYQLCYHIVREADLLASYDFDRSIIYHMNNIDSRFLESLKNSIDFFKQRVLMHEEDGLFITKYSKTLSRKLKIDSINQIQKWTKIL